MPVQQPEKKKLLLEDMAANRQNIEGRVKELIEAHPDRSDYELARILESHFAGDPIIGYYLLTQYRDDSAGQVDEEPHG